MICWFPFAKGSNLAREFLVSYKSKINFPLKQIIFLVSRAMAVPRGGMMRSVPEFEAWVLTNMASLVNSGQDLDFKVMRLATKALLRGRTVSVIPLANKDTMEAHISEFFRVSQARYETKIKARDLFTGVHVLIGGHPEPPPKNERPATPSNPQSTPEAKSGDLPPQAEFDAMKLFEDFMAADNERPATPSTPQAEFAAMKLGGDLDE